MTERESTACSSGTNILTLPEEGINSTNEGNEQHDRIGVRRSKCKTGRHHQAGRTNEEPALIGPGAQEAYPQGHQGRAKQRRGRHDADLQGPEPERRQIDRQQHGDETIAEVA